METVHIDAANGSYDIRIGEGMLNGWKPEGTYGVLTDENVYRYYGDYFPSERYADILTPGESSKRLRELESILEGMVEIDLDRGSVFLTFGGGVVGDIGGLAAAMYKRGIPYIQIPTTLLAMIDSSVGGKVAVDLESGKNLAGAFYQPSLVIADLALLKTLPAREFAAGIAEAIKYGYIADPELLERLRAQTIDLEWIVGRCCRIKGRYVEEDPLDTGARMQLNYGHTLGHAIETVAGYGNYLHGEGVAIGMVLAARLGERLGVSPKGLESQTRALVEAYGLPSRTEPEILNKALQILNRDKKAIGDEVNLVLIDEIGHAVAYRIPVREVAQVLSVHA